jgi:Endodeoxyribonuclease RusA
MFLINERTSARNSISDEERLLRPVTVVIAGEPVAKGRPRITRRGFAYTPAATRKYEAHGRLAAQMAMAGRQPIDVPVRIELLVELPVPASWSKRKTADAITGHIRPSVTKNVLGLLPPKQYLNLTGTIANLVRMLQRTLPAGFIAPCLPIKTGIASPGVLKWADR